MSLFSGITRIVTGIVSFVNGTGGNISTFASKLFLEIPAIVSEIKKLIAMKANGLDDTEKLLLVKSAFMEFDVLTGETGLSFFGSLTEEEKQNEEYAIDSLMLFMWYAVLKELNIKYIPYDNVKV